MASSYFTRPCGGYHDEEHGFMPSRFDYNNKQHIYSLGPLEQKMAYNKRAISRSPFTVFVSGIHPETTDEGISNIFSLYGIPSRILKRRNKNNQIIASVDFATQMEAHNAVKGLNGKPPLYWKVTFSLEHISRHDPQNFEQDTITNGLGFYDTPSMLPPSQGAVPPFTGAMVPYRGIQSFPNALRVSNEFPSYPPCIICGIPSESACSKCKTPYCSVNCQHSDWYVHKNGCVAPPALEPVKPWFNDASQLVHPSGLIPSTLSPLESDNGAPKSPIKNEERAVSPSNGLPALPNGQNRFQPLNERSPKENGNSGLVRPEFLPMENLSSKSEIAIESVPIMSPPDSPIRKDIYAKAFTSNKLSPLCDRPSQIIVRTAKSPDNFFIQYLTFKEMLGTLTNELQLSARNAPPLMEPVLENSPCLAFCPINEKWLRAQVIKVWDNAVGVFFVDYGYKVKLRNTPEHIRMMEYEFGQKPFFAIEAHLAEVVPLEGNNWPDEVNTKFKSLVEDREFKMEFVQSEKDLVMVRLANSKGGDLASYLVNQKMANFSHNAASSGSVSSISALVQSEALSQPTIPKASLETGVTTDVIILAADDLDAIFVQPIKDEFMVAMTDLQEALNKYFENSTPLNAIPSVGTYIASTCPDDNGFYRARVESVRGDAVKVHYIDFGNSCEVTLAELRSLPHELFEFPNFTYKVSLASVSRPESIELPMPVKTLLSTLINHLGIMSVIDSTDSSVDCTLIVDGIIVNHKVDELLEAALKKPAVASPLPKPTCEEKLELTDQQQVDIFRYEDGSFLELPGGDFFQAMIFSVESPQMIMMCEGNESILTKLDQLQNDMAEYAASSVLGHTPVEGEVCIVRSMEDEGWYRGACLQIVSNSFQFLLVDFGSMVTCFIDDVRRIPKRFVECLPYVAQHAILKGCENIPEIGEDLAKRVTELLPVNALVEVKVENKADASYVVDIPSVYSVLKAEGLL